MHNCRKFAETCNSGKVDENLKPVNNQLPINNKSIRLLIIHETGMAEILYKTYGLNYTLRIWCTVLHLNAKCSNDSRKSMYIYRFAQFHVKYVY